MATSKDDTEQEVLSWDDSVPGRHQYALLTGETRELYYLDLARDREERELALAGFPPEYWHTSLDDFGFIGTNLYGRKLSPEAQRHWVKILTRYGGSRRNRVAVISSAPTDSGAMTLAFFILKELSKLGKEVAICDVANMPETFLRYPHCLALHNILAGTDAPQLRLMRNAIGRINGALKLVVVAGDTDPFKFATVRLGIYPNVVLRVQDIIPVVTR